MQKKVPFSASSQSRPYQKRATPIADIVAQLVDSCGLGKSFNGWQIVEKWPLLVRNTAAEGTRALRFNDGVLYVQALEAPLRQLLHLHAEQLLKIIRATPEGHAVQRLSFVSGTKGMTEHGA